MCPPRPSLVAAATHRTYGLAQWGMSTSQLVDLFGTPHAMYAVVDSSASYSICSSVVSLGASLAEVPVASVGTCVDTGPEATPEDASLSFTLDSGASHCFFRDRTTLTPLPTPVPVSNLVAASPQVAVSGQVPVSGPVAASFSCRSLAHPTVLWHHRMGHPSISRLRAMSSQRLVLGIPHVLPSLSPSLAPPCGPCVEGRMRATPYSSSLRLATEPFETLYLDVWSPPSRPGPERESFFLVVVDYYSRYTTVSPLAKKSDVTSTLIRWLLTTADTRGRRVNCLHSDRGGLVMEIPHTSMTHARAPHFLWPYAVCLWTGSPGAASRFHVWGCLALVRDTSADKISPRAVPCVFLYFPEDSSDYTFYHPPFHQTFFSRDVRFVESVPYYVTYPYRDLLVPPPPLFLTSAPPPAPAVQPPLPADPAGADFRGEDPRGASSRGAGVGAESVPVRGPGSGCVGVGAEPVTAGESSIRGVGVSGAVPGGATTGGAPSAGPGEPGTNPATSGGAGSGGGATGSLESGPGATTTLDTTPPPHSYPTRNQARWLEEQQQPPHLEEQRLQPQQEQQQHPPPPPISGLRTLGLPSPSPPFPPSPPISGPPLPPPNPSPAVFPPLPPLSPPLSHAWPLRHSPRARPSSPIPFTDLRTALFRSSPPCSSPSVLPSPPESPLTASLSTPVTDYYRTYRPFASTRYLDYATSLVAAPTSPLAVGGESALGYDALEDRQFELEFLAAASLLCHAARP
ncbi:unnamed protein product [Closterium sp. NIES-54]